MKRVARPGSVVSRRIVTLLACNIASAAGMPTAQAQSVPACVAPVLTLAEAASLLRVDEDPLRELAERGGIPARRIANAWRFNCDSLMQWLEGETSAVAAERAGATPLAETELEELSARGTGAVVQPQPERRDTTGVPDADQAIGQAPDERTAEDVLLRDQRVLLDRRQVVLDFGQFYSESNGQLLALTDDGFSLATVEQETFFSTLQARIGLSNNSEFFIGTTYFDQESDVFSGNQKIARAHASDLGSVNLGLRRTLVREGSGRPNIIGALSTGIPTGDSSYVLGGGLSFVKSYDPAILFASINYAHTFSRDFADLTLLEPEDQASISFGYALALNDTLALSMAVSSTFTGATSFDTAALRQQDRHALRFGLTSWLASGVYIEPSVTFNLGGPDDSFLFGLTVPYTLGRRSR